MFLAVDEGVDVVRSKFDRVAVGDGISRASLDTVAAEDAARVVDVIDLRVALAGGDAPGLRVLRGFDVDTVRRARRGAEKTSYAFLESVFVALKYVNPAVARLDAWRDVREAFRGRLAKHGQQSDAEALVERQKCFADFSYDRCHRPSL